MTKPLLVLALALAVPAGAAHASTGGRVRDVQATPIYQLPITLDANVEYTISTTGLSPTTADTVLHVQDADDANGGFIAGNDDFSGLASSVHLVAAPAVRHVTILVHAYTAGAAGTGQLVIATPSAINTVPISFGGSRVALPPEIVTTHVMTVQQAAPSSRNTILLVTSGSIGNAIESDDNDGIDGMSWLHLNVPCVAPCVAIVGSTAPDTAGLTTLLWDDGMHTTQCDADGVGDGLELAIGTDPCNNDTDGDGLSDGAELGGVNSFPAVKLPMYGADPLRKDLFLETDWVRCDAIISPGFNCQGNPDFFKISPAQALQIASYYAPDVAVHIDNGFANTDPATRTIYNDWGGATQIGDGRGKCDDLTPVRVGYFHHGLINGTSGGQADGYNGYCFWSGTAPPAVAHELAHGMGLDHGGGLGRDDDINSKPNYRSLMNYSFIYDSTVTQFSRNEHPTPLNPTAVDETVSIGADDAYLTRGPWSYRVRADGAVDWDRDGTFAKLVRAPLTWSAFSSDQSLLHLDGFDNNQSVFPAGAWLPSANRLYLLTTNRATGTLQYRTTDLAHIATCRNAGAVNGCTGWTPAPTAAPGVVPGSIAVLGGAAAAGYLGPAGPELVAAYRDTANHLRGQVLALNAAGGEVWTTPAVTDSQILSGDPAAAAFAGKVYALAPVGGGLVRWLFNPSGRTWTAGAAQRWSDGTAIQVSGAVALTVGYQADLAAAQLYAVMPLPGSPSSLVLARYDAASDLWVKLRTGFASSVGRPGLAYVPANAAQPAIGKFYVSFGAGSGDPAQPIAMIASSQGNDPAAGATTRRLDFDPPAYVGNVGRITNSGTALLFAPGIDSNLRAMMSFLGSDASGVHASTLFAPLADGIFNINLRDFDDYAQIKSHLGCSLTRSCP